MLFTMCLATIFPTGLTKNDHSTGLSDIIFGLVSSRNFEKLFDQISKMDRTDIIRAYYSITDDVIREIINGIIKEFGYNNIVEYYDAYCVEDIESYFADIQEISFQNVREKINEKFAERMVDLGITGREAKMHCVELIRILNEKNAPTQNVQTIDSAEQNFSILSEETHTQLRPIELPNFYFSDEDDVSAEDDVDTHDWNDDSILTGP